MSDPASFVTESPRSARIVSRADVVVVGGGPTWFSSAVAAARNHARVVFTQRQTYDGRLKRLSFLLQLEQRFPERLRSLPCISLGNQLPRIGRTRRIGQPKYLHAANK